jgi:hypothetical protein
VYFNFDDPKFGELLNQPIVLTGIKKLKVEEKRNHITNRLQMQKEQKCECQI